MPTIMIAVRCPLCGKYMDTKKMGDDVFYCECNTIVDVSKTKVSDWGLRRKAERERLTGRPEILPAGPPDFSRSGGSKSGKKKRKKKLARRMAVMEQGPYDT